MKKWKTSRLTSLLAAGAMFFGGFFTSCSFLETEESDYDKNALLVAAYLAQKNSGNSMGGATEKS